MMETRIKTSDYEMPSEVAAYLEERITAIERLISDDAARCEVELGKSAGHPQQGNIWMAEFVVVQKGERFVAKAVAESVNAAIDIAKDEMQEQLRRSKGKHSTLARRAGARIKAWARWNQ